MWSVGKHCAMAPTTRGCYFTSRTSARCVLTPTGSFKPKKPLDVVLTFHWLGGGALRRLDVHDSRVSRRVAHVNAVRAHSNGVMHMAPMVSHAAAFLQVQRSLMGRRCLSQRSGLGAPFFSLWVRPSESCPKGSTTCIIPAGHLVSVDARRTGHGLIFSLPDRLSRSGARHTGHGLLFS